MIVLNTANRSLQYLLGGAVAANQLPFVVQYVNVTREGVTHNNSANGISNSGTAVTVLGAPSAGEKRVIQSFSVYNADTASATVTVRLNDNGTLRNIVVVTLSASDHLIYTNAAGWFVLTSAGFIKSTSTAVNLDDLGDVSITSPAAGAVLTYNGTNWVDGQVDLDDADAVTGTLAIANGGTNSATAAAARTALGAEITLGTEVASTSGTAIDFTGIPAGTRRITVMFIGVSTNNTSNYLIQIGDAGGIEATGYTSSADQVGGTAVTSTAGFIVTTGVGAGSAQDGHITLNLEDSTGFTWTSGGNLKRDSTLQMSGGSKSLSAELTQIRITTVTPDTFDLGAINISYES